MQLIGDKDKCARLQVVEFSNRLALRARCLSFQLASRLLEEHKKEDTSSSFSLSLLVLLLLTIVPMKYNAHEEISRYFFFWVLMQPCCHIFAVVELLLSTSSPKWMDGWSIQCKR